MISSDVHEIKKSGPSILFQDGLRMVDFVFVLGKSERESGPGEATETTRLVDEMDEAIGRLDKPKKFNLWRRRFQDNLISEGLDVEEEETTDEDENKLDVIKIHATWTFLCKYAENLNIKVPLHEIPEAEETYENGSETCLSKFCIPNIMKQEVPNEPRAYYAIPFRYDKLHLFIGKDDQESFFSPSQRSRMVYEALANTAFGSEERGEIGINRLLGEGVYAAAFPLHSGPYQMLTSSIKNNQINPMSESMVKVDFNDRHVLYEYWARWGKWYKYQPFKLIRNYFGEKITMYFAWLGFYTAWLIPAMFVGIFVFVHGCFMVSKDKVIQEVCYDTKNITLCPRCEACTTQRLSDTCTEQVIGYFFNNGGSVFYGVFMSFWAVFFLEFWKRKSACFAHDWNRMDFEEVEVARSEFAAKATDQVINPITGKEEPTFSSKKHKARMFVSWCVTIIMMGLVICAMISMIAYRAYVVIPARDYFIHLHTKFNLKDIDFLIFSSFLDPTTIASAFVSLTASLMELIFLLALSIIFEYLAPILTEWEMHKTQTKFDDNLSIKLFLFNFFNYFSWIFYTAFIKGKYVGRPGDYTKFGFGKQNESCSFSGCQFDVMTQLVSIFLGVTILRQLLDWLWRRIRNCCRGNKSKLDEVEECRIKQEFKLAEKDDLTWKYLYLTLQYGFVTLFVGTSPLLPIVAVVSNWIAIRLEAQNYVCHTRRPVAHRRKDIGIWFNILSFLALTAIITNASVISFTSDFVERTYYAYNIDDIGEDYTSWRLTLSPKDYDGEPCYYSDFRDDDGNYSLTHWMILTLKLVLFITFVLFVLVIRRCVLIAFPEVPRSLQIKIKREEYLVQQANSTKA